MTVASSKKWIILLNKSPRGPFSEEEIKELMSQGLLRHNDLGFLVPQAGESQESFWKFLWQFPEFDSRLKEKESPPPPAVLEKRKPRSEEEIKKDVEEHIPLDLKAIRVEDLILKTQAIPKRDFSSTKNREERESSSQKKAAPNFSTPRTRPLFALLGIGAVVVCVFLVLQEFKGTSSNAGSRNLSSSEAGPSKISGAPNKGGLPSARKGEQSTNPPQATPKTAPPSSKPAERDRGEVREEELLRIREEERKRELDEQLRQKRLEEERNREENEEDEAEEDEKRPRKSRGKSKRRVDSQDEIEEDAEESPGNETTGEEEGPSANWVD